MAYADVLHGITLKLKFMVHRSGSGSLYCTVCLPQMHCFVAWNCFTQSHISGVCFMAILAYGVMVRCGECFKLV